MPHMDQTNTRAHTESERNRKHFIKERDPKRKTQTWFRSSSRRGSVFLILCSFFVLYGFDLGCYSMLWCDWFDFIVFTLFQLVWLLRNRRKILEMEWIGYCVYGFISWVDLIWFFLKKKFMGKAGLNLGILFSG